MGSHAAKVLAGAGFEPVVYDNLERGHRRAVRWGPLVEADLRDGAALRRALCEHECEAVLHFAALAYVGESVTDPRRYFENNVGGTLELLGAMQDCGVAHIVFSSTCATYGEPQTDVLAEDHPQAPINPYGDTKLYIERALRWYSEAYGLRYMALRYFNAAGADPEGEIGEAHDPETHLIPIIIEAARGIRSHVSIFGTDYPTPDGTAIRDYVHVMDLADAHVLALRHLVDGGACGALNLGTENGSSVREVIAAVERVSGQPIEVREAARRAGDPPRLVADARRARDLLGWEPRYADLDVVVETAWRWHTEHQAQEQG